MEYKVDIMAPDDLVKINFRLGFRVAPRINLFFRKVLEEMVKNKEVDITSRYESLSKQNVIGDFRFVVFERFLSYENELPLAERLTMEAYFFVKNFTNSDDKWFGLDTSAVKVEKVPLIIRPAANVELKRINPPDKAKRNGKMAKNGSKDKSLEPEDKPPLVRYS